MIRIDGSAGGGQILRTSLALSAYTGEPFEIEGVRGNRPSPGLARQHLAGVETAAELCGAEVEGASMGSDRVSFRPGDPERRVVDVDIGTAGSVTLLLQAVLLPATVAGAEFRIRGGTDVKWSPPWDYFSNVTLPLLRRGGMDVSAELVRRGYYPEGGGEVQVTVGPSDLTGFDLTERGDLERVRGVAHAANLPDHVLRREVAAAETALEASGHEAEVMLERDDDAVSTGTGVVLWAEHSESAIGASSLGERGKPAEDVGREAAEALERELSRSGTLDRHAGDQLLPFVAVGGGRYTATERTDHLETNARTTESFLDADVALDGEGPVTVRVE